MLVSVPRSEAKLGTVPRGKKSNGVHESAPAVAVRTKRGRRRHGHRLIVARTATGSGRRKPHLCRQIKLYVAAHAIKLVAWEPPDTAWRRAAGRPTVDASESGDAAVGFAWRRGGDWGSADYGEERLERDE